MHEEGPQPVVTGVAFFAKLAELNGGRLPTAALALPYDAGFDGEWVWKGTKALA